MDSAGRVEQIVAQLLSGLDHVDLTYLVSDICTLSGWDTRVGIDDPETVGDVVATQHFPHPHTVSIACHTDDELRKDELADLRRSIGSDSTLAVVARVRPTERSIEFARTEGILLFSLYDLAHEIVDVSGVDVVRKHIHRDEELSAKYGAS